MSPSPVTVLIRAEGRRQRLRLASAALAAASAAAAAVLLLGLSGWFLAGAAAAGAGGAAAVLAFNFLLPSAGIRFLAVTRTGARYVERLVGHEAALLALAGLRAAIFAGLAAAPAQRALAVSSGEATGRLTQDVDAIETHFIRRSAPWAGAAALAAAAILIALASPWAAGAFLCLFALQTATGRLLGSRLTCRPGAEALVASSRLKDAFQAVAAAAPEVRCYGISERVIEDLMMHDDALGAAAARRWSAEALTGIAPALLTGVAVATVLALAWREPASLAVLAALAALAGMEGGAPLARMFDRDGALNAALVRLDSLIAPEAPDVPAPAAGLDLHPGEHVALVGPSGGGKTALLEALVGVRGGAFDRARFSLAPQDARMISGTVRENLQLADPAATDAALWSVLADACLDAKIRSLPQGLDAWIGEGGERLSGGERRRLSLARAYLRPAPVLLLDEPTEGLDAATEAAVVTALADRIARTGQTLVIASHRPAPLALCERVQTIGVVA